MSNKAKLVIVLLAVVLGGPLACTTTSPGKVAASSDFAGTYSLDSIDGHAVPHTLQLEGQGDLIVVSGTFTLNSDGTMVSITNLALPSGDTMSRDVKGTYTREGSDFDMTWLRPEVPGGVGRNKVTIDGSTLTMINDGLLFVYQK